MRFHNALHPRRYRFKDSKFQTTGNQYDLNLRLKRGNRQFRALIHFGFIPNTKGVLKKTIHFITNKGGIIQTKMENDDLLCDSIKNKRQLQITKTQTRLQKLKKGSQFLITDDSQGVEESSNESTDEDALSWIFLHKTQHKPTFDRIADGSQSDMTYITHVLKTNPQDIDSFVFSCFLFVLYIL